ncbi:hypothetical protein A3H11_03860 [Candidatus Uhrbacteria bacterium RIFCSPLOWO2_12_FULL_47_10]|nr:MAG: hypothetical protein A3H11_03860 [Candidatus Uhrbacteria bacterium RIFCSPLOWO2_12_FULL_47_10]
MARKLLQFFLKTSAVIFFLKEKMIKTNGLFKTALYAVVIILMEFIFAIISLPLFLLVSPHKLQEKGFIFPIGKLEHPHLKSYAMRRKISIATIGGAGGIFIAKILFISIVSSYLLGVQPLLAATFDWTFGASSDFSFDSSKIEVTGGVARLKNLGTTTSGATTNSGFTTDATGWTYADWDQGGVCRSTAGSSS